MINQVVAVTGGTGSFGKSMVKELLTKGVKQIRVLSRDELKQSQMKEEINDSRVEFFICDIRDAERLITATEDVDIVIHAAAMKRIEVCEKDPQEAVKTNINGTVNVANACLRNNVKNAIFISTDKACYPVNLYGATKLTAEKVWIQSNTYRGRNHPTKFSVVRYGNVLGSRGSVLHSFKNQLTAGVLKVTDQYMTRFFITLQEAVDLVQLAIEEQQGGEIYTPNLKAVSIFRMAEMIAGKAPVVITNQRGGEKLHETLITVEECKRTECHGKYNVTDPEITTWPYTRNDYNIPKFVTSETSEQYTDEELKKLLIHGN